MSEKMLNLSDYWLSYRVYCVIWIVFSDVCKKLQLNFAKTNCNNLSARWKRFPRLSLTAFKDLEEENRKNKAYIIQTFLHSQIFSFASWSGRREIMIPMLKSWWFWQHPFILLNVKLHKFRNCTEFQQSRNRSWALYQSFCKKRGQIGSQN